MPRVALVVDDSMLIRHTIRRFLERRGFQVESATNGREALDIVNRSLPSVVITDLQMPVMSGQELISELKARPGTAAIPILVLAARRGALEVQPETSAHSVIYKDIDLEQQLEMAIEALG
jgi:CheY-like chemotaxis protein